MTGTHARLAQAIAMAVAVAAGPSDSRAATVAPNLRWQAQTAGSVPVLLSFPDQATPALAPVRADADPLTRRRALVASLQARARTQQAATRAWLDARGITYRAYWVAIVIATRLDAGQLDALARRTDIGRIVADTPVPMATLEQPLHLRHIDVSRPLALTWGLEEIDVLTAWAHGVSGQGVVVAGADTGYHWQHPAIKARYRGWDGTSAVHDYNWHDAIHVGGSNCGGNATAPCDDDGHGTHTMGTMVGNAQSGQAIGVAPDASWIGCRNMNEGIGTPSRYIECMQWFLAPTDLAGNNPDPAKAPDVINNSWACTSGEGCTSGEEIHAAVDNVVAGGIFFAVAAGNEGSSCGSIINPPAIYESAFTVAASNGLDKLTNFSSRGPVSGQSAVILDITAPGAEVYSSVPPNGYSKLSGTSMATPHVSGVAALVMSVNPALKGHPDEVAAILQASAVRTGLSDSYHPSGCGGLDLTDWPNHQFGYGRLDAWAAVRLADTLFLDGFEQ